MSEASWGQKKIFFLIIAIKMIQFLFIGYRNIAKIINRSVILSSQ